MCKISIIVPIYNTAKYLKETLDSIINQSFKDIEIILINDGSTDNSLEIATSYANKDNRITVINQSNMGVAVARNKGLKIAKGEYIICLDSDDIFDIDMLETLYTNAKNTQADIIICHERSLYDNGLSEEIPWPMQKETVPVNTIFCAKDFPNYIFNFCILWPWDKLYKKTFLDENNIKFPEDKKMIASEDLVFCGETFALANKILVIENILITHRYHSTSLEYTRNKVTGYLALKNLKEKLLKRNLYTLFEKSFLNCAIHYLCWHYSRRINDKKETQKMMRSWFKYFGIFNKKREYFYNTDEYDWIKNILSQKYTFLEKIFSIKNDKSRPDKVYKVVTILGLKLKLKKGVKINV